MFRCKLFWVLFSFLLLSQPACFWRLWTGKNDPEKQRERVYDLYGTVESVTVEKLVVTTKRGQRTFLFSDASIKGSDFAEGARVHVYFKQTDTGDIITMVVEKVS